MWLIGWILELEPYLLLSWHMWLTGRFRVLVPYLSTSVLVCVVDWFNFRANRVFTYVFSAFRDTKLSTSVLV